jgi:hypothetical protein
VGRVLATQYEEVVVDRVFAGNVQLIKALQPLVEAAEGTLQLDETKRARTILRVDAGAGTLDDLNWLLARGYEIMAKEYSGPRVLRSHKIQRYGILRMVRDVFHISGLLRFDAYGSVAEIMLNQQACLARSFIRPLQELLTPLHIVVSLGET